MSKVPQTVTERVWQRIIDDGNGTAFLVENEGPPEFVPSRAGALTVRPEILSVSWRTYGLMVAQASLFLQSQHVKAGDRVGVLGVDSPEWMVLNRAIQCQGAIVVPLYVDTTPDQIAHVINNSGAAIIISESTKTQDKHIKNELITDKSVVKFLNADILKDVPYFRGENRPPKPLPRGWQPTATERPADFSRAAYAEFERLKTLFTTDGFLAVLKPTDPCVLIYTSGSTSLPKGAIHTPRSIFCSTKIILSLGFDLGVQDLMMHFLPFAHIYGLANGLELCEYQGVVSAFCSKESFKKMMPKFQPTAVLLVPKLLNRMMNEAETQGNKGLMGHVYRWAFRQKKTGILHAVADLLVFGKIRKKMGLDRVRLTMTGSAACPMETHQYFNAIGIPLREGYGATETCGGITANTLTEFKYKSLGKVPQGVEYKIVPRPGIDTEANTGKLWVRGPFLFSGYWNDPVKTKASFDAEGWYDTGDIVHEDEDGFLWYRGRASRQKKLDTGEFYGEEAIQSVAENNELFAAVVPTGEGYSSVGALIFLDKAVCKRISGVSAPDGMDPYEFYAKHDAIVAAIKKAIADSNEKLAQRPEHKKWEVIRCWTVVPVELVQESGLLTSNGLKVKNEEVLKRFADLIKSMYASSTRS